MDGNLITVKVLIVEIWCLTLYLFRRLGELTLIVPCYFGHSSVNLGHKIALKSLFYRAYQGVLATKIWGLQGFICGCDKGKILKLLG